MSKISLICKDIELPVYVLGFVDDVEIRINDADVANRALRCVRVRPPSG